MQIGVVDYGVGNIANVMRCLEYVARTESIKRVSTHKDIQACDKIILPGVGAFGSAMDHLSARDLDKSLCEYAKSGRYMLGICLGMQLLFEKSYEFGEYKGLGLVEGFVAPFGSKDSIEWHIKTNMGFNGIESKGLDSKQVLESNVIACHIECSEKADSIEAKKDFSPMAQNDNKQNLDSKNFAPQSPAPTHKDQESRFCENTPQNTTLTQVSEKLDSKTMACHTEPLGEVSSIKSNKDISCLHTQYDKNLDSSKNCTPNSAPTQAVENLESIYTNIQALYATNNNKAQNTHLKIPHIGWNKNFIKKPHNLCASMKDSFYLYFVHSYHVCCDTRFIIAACDYGISFPSIIGKENILGIQPHPERSHEMGFKLMRDFLQLR